MCAGDCLGTSAHDQNSRAEASCVGLPACAWRCVQEALQVGRQQNPAAARPIAATAQKDRPRGLTKVFTGWQDNEADTKAIRGVVVEDDSTAAPDSGAATAQKDRPRGLTTVFTGWQSDEAEMKADAEPAPELEPGTDETPNETDAEDGEDEAEAANEKEWKDLREHERAAASLLGWQSAEARIPKHPRIRVCVYLHTDHLSGPASTSLCFACIGMEWRH